MDQKYTLKDCAKMSAEKELSKYTDYQINELANKEKKVISSTIVLFSIIAVLLLVLFVFALINDYIVLMAISVTFGGGGILGCVISAIFDFKKTNYILAREYLERKYQNNPHASYEFIIYENHVEKSTSSANIDTTDNYSQKAYFLMDTQKEYNNWCEEKILIESIRESWESLSIIINPILLFGKNLGLTKESLMKILKKAYNFGVSKTINDLIIEINIEKNKEKTNLNECFEKEVVEELLNCNFDEMFLELYALQETDKARLKNSMRSILDGIDDEYYWDFYKHQFVLAFLKLQLYGRIISKISENKELSKLLNNAYKKFNDMEECAHKTYDFVFDYISLSNENLTRENYFSLLKIFYLIKNNYISNLENIFSEVDPAIISVNEFVNEFINKKLYVNYDIKSVISIVFAKKMRQSFTLKELIEEVFKIEEYEQKVKGAKLKNELLCDDDSERIAIADIDLMSGTEFEEFLCNYFNGMGYKCEKTKTTGDQGVDLIATKNDSRIAIQAKCYSGVVGNHAIMEVFAGAKYYNTNKCMVITNSKFTKSAIELAKSNGVILWDRQVLIDKLNNL